MTDVKTLTPTPLPPNDFLGRRFANFLRWPVFPLLGMTKNYPMRLEEFTDDGHLVVRAELPGLDPDKDIEVVVNQGQLTIHAERRTERRTETKRDEKGGYYSEWRYGSFERTVPLPVGTGREDASATYDKGVLEVRMPVAEGVASKKRMRIPVSH